MLLVSRHRRCTGLRSASFRRKKKPSAPRRGDAAAPPPGPALPARPTKTARWSSSCLPATRAKRLAVPNERHERHERRRPSNYRSRRHWHPRSQASLELWCNWLLFLLLLLLPAVAPPAAAPRLLVRPRRPAPAAPLESTAACCVGRLAAQTVHGAGRCKPSLASPRGRQAAAARPCRR
jgi:hypothetical protein